MAGLHFAPLCHLQPKNYSNILRLFIISTTRNPVQTPRPPGSKAEWKDSPDPQSLQPKHIPWKKYCSWMSINKLTCLSPCKSHVLKRKSHPQMVCVLLPATLLHVSVEFCIDTNATESWISSAVRGCCTLVELLGNTKNAESGQDFFAHIYALQIFFFLRWQWTYGEST